MKATIRHYLELAAQWLIGWLMEQFLADPIAHLEDALKQLAEVKGGGAQPENPSLTLPAADAASGGEGTVGSARSVGGARRVWVTHQAAANAAWADRSGRTLALGIVFVLASIVFLAGFVVGRVL